MSSSGGGEHSGIGFATMRGRDYPSIRQYTVFLENRVGQLLEVVRRFGHGARLALHAREGARHRQDLEHGRQRSHEPRRRVEAAVFAVESRVGPGSR